MSQLTTSVRSVVEIASHSSKPYPDSFIDVRLDGVFAAPDGKEARLPVSSFHSPEGRNLWQNRRTWPWSGREQALQFDRFNIDYFKAADQVVQPEEQFGVGLERIMEVGVLNFSSTAASFSLPSGMISGYPGERCDGSLFPRRRTGRLQTTPDCCLSRHLVRSVQRSD